MLRMTRGWIIKSAILIMSSNIIVKGTWKILSAALLPETIRYCEKKSGSKSTLDLDLLASNFDSLILIVTQITPDVIVSDGVAKIESKILSKNSIPLSSLADWFIKVTKWRVSLKNSKTLFENDTSRSNSRNLLELKLEISEFEVLEENFDLKASSPISLEEIP